VHSLKFNGTKMPGQVEERSFHQKYYEKIMGTPDCDTSKDVGPGKYDPALLDKRKTFSIR